MKRLPVRPFLAAGALLACACVVAARPAPPPVMPPAQAVSIAAGFARSRGIAVDYTIGTRLDRAARWHVELGGAGGRDHAMVVVDGYSGAIVRARLRGPRGVYSPELPPPPPGQAPGAAPPPPAAGEAPPPSSETTPGATPPAPPPGNGAPPPPPPGAPPPPTG